MEFSQKDRAFKVSSPLPFDTLLFYRMHGEEELGRLFRYDLELLSPDDSINIDDILGGPMLVSVECTGSASHGQKRLFHGLVSRFGLVGYVGRLALYRAELRPWFWFLSRTADCRIFQDKSVPDIAKEIFRENGFSDFQDLCVESYAPREYCVQYRESDFNFISRLFEQEGIYYYFEHQEEKHTLVMADSALGHEDCALEGPLPYLTLDSAGMAPEREYVHSWRIERTVQPGAYVHTDYDFVKPRADLMGTGEMSRSYTNASFEVFDYPALAYERSQSDTYARTRIEEMQADYEEASAATNCRTIAAGCLFELDGFPRADQNRKYLVKAASYRLEADDYQTTQNAPPETFQAHFRAMSTQEAFRPARITPKPVVQGPQTAAVVGKKGEEIWTDKYGRVKVRFHWDREGKADENSSCWIRVAQVWAGKRWGGMMIPRIGQEVIVDFLEGDPDRPIVTGRVYNADCMPPYPLPDKATMTALKSNSSKGGGGFNELRLEDKKGEEQVFIHAERNQDIRVKKDVFEWVGNERHLIVKTDLLEQVDGDKHLTVKGDSNAKVNGTVSLDVKMDLQQKVGTKHALDAGQEIHLKGGMNVVIEAGTSITLKAGGGFVVVGPAGVTISGTPVLINSGGSAGSGSGCSPDAAKPPQEADKAEPGSVSQPPVATKKASAKPAQLKPLSLFTNPQAATIANAQKSGTPFCEKCEAARKAREAQQARESQSETADDG